MKEIILLMISGASVLVTVVYGQGISDLVGQQGKQIKALKDQIAELLVFKSTLEKGYAIATEGAGKIMVLKQTDLDMHAGHFDSLKKVKTSLKDDPLVEETRECLRNSRAVATQIVQLSGNGRSKDKYLALIGPEYAVKVLKECDRDQQELDKLLADDRFSMTDNERLERLLDIHERVGKRYLFAVNIDESIMYLQEKEGL